MKNPAGAHPQNPIPAGRCGSFSFLSRNKPLFFIWTQHGHAHPTVAWIRSLHIGSAIVTFHPTIWAQHNGIWQYIFAANIQLAAVPILAKFSIFQDQQPLPLGPIFNRMYILSNEAPEKEEIQGKYAFLQNHPLYETHQVSISKFKNLVQEDH
jgi:hypothetical protein